MNDIDTDRIKSKFYDKLRDEKKRQNKRLKIKSLIAVAAVVSLTSITVFAANMGVFNTLFSNFYDVSDNVRLSPAKVKSNGVTMSMSSYLADNMGIVPELVFTKDDGSSFPSDTMAVYKGRYVDGLMLGDPSVKVNNVLRAASSQNRVSEDGKSYYCLPIIHYDIEDISNSTIDISIDKLLYSMKESIETIDLDLYNAYKNADVKSYEIKDPQDAELIKIFDKVEDKPIQTKIGMTIYSISFAKIKTGSADIADGMPPADGVDIAGISPQKYDNIIAIKYTGMAEKDGVEYSFWPKNLLTNSDPLGIFLDAGNNTYYRLFRVNDFEDLKNIGGITFRVNSNNFIKGDWHLKTNFASNQNQSTIVINKEFNTDNEDSVINLIKADISLFSTKLNYEIRDNKGNLLTNINGYDLNTYYLNNIINNKVKLLYSDGSEIELSNSSFASEPGGAVNIFYNVEMNPDVYTLMNTGKLSAIVINGESFKID